MPGDLPYQLWSIRLWSKTLAAPLVRLRSRHLLAGEVPPKRTGKLVRDLVGLLLGAPID